MGMVRVGHERRAAGANLTRTFRRVGPRYSNGDPPSHKLDEPMCRLIWLTGPNIGRYNKFRCLGVAYGVYLKPAVAACSRRLRLPFAMLLLPHLRPQHRRTRSDDKSCRLPSRGRHGLY